MDYLRGPSNKVEFKTKHKALKYTKIGDELYGKTFNGGFLKYVNQFKSMQLMGEIHEGLCGVHKFGPMMKRLIIRHGYYWPTITTDCYHYAKRCQE